MHPINTRLLLFFGLLLSVSSYAQRMPVFADYHLNRMLINPAYSGFRSQPEILLSHIGSFNRIEGSPRTFSATASTSVRRQRIGLGAGALTDQIGVTSTTKLFGAYAYKIPLGSYNSEATRWNLGTKMSGNGGTRRSQRRATSQTERAWRHDDRRLLAFGLSTGVLFINEDLMSLNIQNDSHFASNVGETVPTFGFGALYNEQHFYLGLSTQNVLSRSFVNTENLKLETPYYLHGGVRVYSGHPRRVRVEPNVLARFVAGAPLQVDFNTTINYQNRFEIGAGYRTTASLNFFAGMYYLQNLRLAFVYNQAGSPVSSVYGVILNYRLDHGSY